MELTRFQRLILANQYKILEHVDPDHADHYREQRRIFEDGYEIAYDWNIDVAPDEDTLGGEDGEFVIDVLSMYEILHDAYDRLEPEDMDRTDIEFPGFHKDEETGLHGFTDFLIEQQGKFQSITLRGGDFQSTVPMRGEYQRMLSAWEKSEELTDLTKEDLRRILDVRG